MAAWWPYWIFLVSGLTLLWLLISTPNFSGKILMYMGKKPIDFLWPHFLNGCLVAISDFSVSGWHGFGSITQVCFGISVSNFMCMSFVAVGRNLTIVSYVAFKMAALWFWTMINCNPPIAHCHPLLWGGGILVDHWSTISSWFRQWCFWLILHKAIAWINADLMSAGSFGMRNTIVCTSNGWYQGRLAHFCHSGTHWKFLRQKSHALQDV